MALLPEHDYQLRLIADRLHADDPSLAAYLAGTTRRRRPKVVLAVVYLVPAAFLGVALILDVPLVLLAGLIATPSVPIVGTWLLRPRSRRTPRRTCRPHRVPESEE